MNTHPLPGTGVLMPKVLTRKTLAIQFGMLLTLEALMYYLAWSASLVSNATLSWVMIIAALAVTFAVIIICIRHARKNKWLVGDLGAIIIPPSCLFGFMNLMMVVFKLIKMIPN